MAGTARRCTVSHGWVSRGEAVEVGPGRARSRMVGYGVAVEVTYGVLRCFRVRSGWVWRGRAWRGEAVEARFGEVRLCRVRRGVAWQARIERRVYVDVSTD